MIFKMKCYFFYDEKSKRKILIPYCWSVVLSNDIQDCNCSQSFTQFERERYNDLIKDKNKIIAEMQKEIARLNSRVEFWQNKNKK